jgi:hypothetical protein
MSGNPQECREHAKNCRELANKAPPSSLGRARFEELAKTWTRPKRVVSDYLTFAAWFSLSQAVSMSLKPSPAQVGASLLR